MVTEVFFPLASDGTGRETSQVSSAERRKVRLINRVNRRWGGGGVEVVRLVRSDWRCHTGVRTRLRQGTGKLSVVEPILYWRFLFVIEETARDGLAENCVQMYVAAPHLERAGVSGCPAQPACATLPTRVRGTH